MTLASRSEASIVAGILDGLERCGWWIARHDKDAPPPPAGRPWAARNQVGALRRGHAYVRYGLGVNSSDIVLVLPPRGRVCWLEVKDPAALGRDHREHEMRQLGWQSAMASIGCRRAFCTTVAQGIGLALEWQNAEDA